MQQNEESVGYGPRPTAPKKKKREKKTLAAQPVNKSIKMLLTIRKQKS